jgi:hypothetical protein
MAVITLNGVPITLNGVPLTLGSASGVSGTAAITLVAPSMSGQGRVAVVGTAAPALSAPGLTTTGRVQVKGSATPSLAAPTLAATGRARVAGQAAVALAAPGLSGAGQVSGVVAGAADIALAAPDLAASGAVPVAGSGFALLQAALLAAEAAVIIPVDPPYDWAPALDLASSPIIGQALRFLRLSPVARHDPASELLPALTEAFDLAIDDLLASADWSFASTVATLAPATIPAPDDALPMSAMLPGDLVVLRQVWPATLRWRIDGQVLRHDGPGAVTLRHTARVTRPEVLPAAFQTALALHIALQLAGRFSGSGADPEALAYAAQVTLKQAMRDDSRQAADARWGAGHDGGLTYGADDDWALEAVA